MENSRIILCIPGPWKDKSEIVEAIARKSEGYILAGNHLSKLVEPSNFFEVEIYDYDEYLAEAFEIAGNGTFSKPQLNQIENHSLAIYLIAEGGSIDKVAKLVEAAYALLEAGGFGVKIESSGIASTGEKWRSLCGNINDEVSLFNAFVTIIEETDFYYTCGMHCFGLSDVITFKNQVSTEYAQDLMRIFCLYNLVERPKLVDSSTFSIDEHNPSFILKHTKCRHFSESHPFHNKYGIWALVKKDV
ncbi:DUF4261 domain-containing protein [Priestia filamentosa]|uniref:DUF4261 domain-containing protein n=1 Tax=Priestia filamentosa TaxID=1402861 RepID=UPI000E7135B4|nr:DUF4261 domain-containing protein [Priestia filamentosa]RJS67252.1 DUF4261 domain-containing protein [Priestia filamentosa]